LPLTMFERVVQIRVSSSMMRIFAIALYHLQILFPL
jgi:hypothetical protein